MRHTDYMRVPETDIFNIPKEFYEQYTTIGD